MGARRDPDLVLVERMLAPPPLEDARSSLAYWQRRRRTLPVYRRRARREAREMAIRWEDRLRAAELIRFEASLPGRVLAALGISGSWVQRLRFGKRGLVRLGWAVVPRPVKLVFGTVAAASVITVVAAVTAVLYAFVQLA